MGYYDMVESAWSLSDAAYEYVQKAGRAVGAAEVWEKVLAPSPLVDQYRTAQEGGNPLTKIFLVNSPYGLQYRPEQNDWLPFRHSAIDLSKEGNI